SWSRTAATRPATALVAAIIPPSPSPEIPSLRPPPISRCTTIRRPPQGETEAAGPLRPPAGPESSSTTGTHERIVLSLQSGCDKHLVGVPRQQRKDRIARPIRGEGSPMHVPD